MKRLKIHVQVRVDIKMLLTRISRGYLLLDDKYLSQFLHKCNHDLPLAKEALKRSERRLHGTQRLGVVRRPRARHEQEDYCELCGQKTARV